MSIYIHFFSWEVDLDRLPDCKRKLWSQKFRSDAMGKRKWPRAWHKPEGVASWEAAKSVDNTQLSVKAQRSQLSWPLNLATRKRPRQKQPGGGGSRARVCWGEFQSERAVGCPLVPRRLIGKGRDRMERGYVLRWEKIPNLHVDANNPRERGKGWMQEIQLSVAAKSSSSLCRLLWQQRITGYQKLPRKYFILTLGKAQSVKNTILFSPISITQLKRLNRAA